MPKPQGWQDATAGTIARIQQIFALHPIENVCSRDGSRMLRGLTEHSKILLYTQAHLIVQAQGRVTNATEYWNTFVNTLRTLVAGMSTVDPQETFD